MSCIAVCEIIDDANSVKCQLKTSGISCIYFIYAYPTEKFTLFDKMQRTYIANEKMRLADSPSGSQTRGRIANSIGGEIPEKYYVVRNNDLLRVKYLLVWAEKTKTKK